MALPLHSRLYYNREQKLLGHAMPKTANAIAIPRGRRENACLLRSSEWNYRWGRLNLPLHAKIFTQEISNDRPPSCTLMLLIDITTWESSLCAREPH